MVKISASMMCGNPLKLEEELQRLETAQVDLLHCDIMDGVFVPNITMGLYMLKAFKEYSSIPLDVHLMVANPDSFLEPLAEIGADYVTVHAETSLHLHRTIQNIKKLGMKAGVALNPSTPVDVIKHVVKDLDLVLIMTVNPGFAGQQFIESTIEKISEVKALLEKNQVEALIEVDGNINSTTIPWTVSAGADVLVLGTSSIFKGPTADYQAEVASIRKMTEQYSEAK
jgi:ribulose-phosphate 3-epimerase